MMAEARPHRCDRQPARFLPSALDETYATADIVDMTASRGQSWPRIPFAQIVEEEPSPMARYDWKKVQRWVLARRAIPRTGVTRGHAAGRVLAWIGLAPTAVIGKLRTGKPSSRLASQPSAVYLALATALTVSSFVSGYIQVIELFPSGGGGYRVASVLVAPCRPHLRSALIVIRPDRGSLGASGRRCAVQPAALFWQAWKVRRRSPSSPALPFANLRGIKEVCAPDAESSSAS